MSNTDATLTLILKAKDLASKEVGGLGKAFGNLGSTAKLAAIGGVGLLVGFMGEAVGAAIEESKNIAKLDAALKANVKGYDGNRAAIEKVIAAREGLSFSDDSLRESLAILVTSTGDVTKAQELQATAMDLARMKGVDLATASTAIAKATQGSTKELKALGLEVKDGATATEILGQVQKATAGQAEAYAGTMAGKWETFNNKLGDVVEDIGGLLLPIISALMDFLLDTAIPAFNQISTVLQPIAKWVFTIAGAIVKFLVPAFGVLGKALGFLVGFWQTEWDIITGIAKGAANVLIGIVNAIIGAVNSIQVHIGKIGLDTPLGFVGVGPFDWNGLQLAKLKYLAEGGIVTKPTLAMVGEKGPEAVIPLDRGGFAGQPVELVIKLDGRELARVIDKHLVYTLRRSTPVYTNG